MADPIVPLAAISVISTNVRLEWRDSQPTDALRNNAPSTEQCSRTGESDESTVAAAICHPCVPVTSVQECFGEWPTAQVADSFAS
jgi:hypothetical protein